MIDVGEKWAVILGVGCVLSRETEKITKAQRTRVDDLEVEILDLANKLCSGKIKVSWPKHPVMKKVDEQLRAGFTQAQLMAMIAGIPPEAQTSYMAVAKREFDFLGMAFPREKLDGLIKPIDVPKNEFDYYKFYGMYRVIDDPLYVFQLISSGGLLVKQAQAVRVVFPSLSAFIDECVAQAFEELTVKAAVSGKTFSLPHKADIGVRDWKSIPVVVKPYQLAYQQGSETIGQKPPQSDKGESPEAKGSLSAAQSRAVFTGRRKGLNMGTRAENKYLLDFKNSTNVPVNGTSVSGTTPIVGEWVRIKGVDTIAYALADTGTLNGVWLAEIATDKNGANAIPFPTANVAPALPTGAASTATCVFTIPNGRYTYMRLTFTPATGTGNVTATTGQITTLPAWLERIKGVAVWVITSTGSTLAVTTPVIEYGNSYYDRLGNYGAPTQDDNIADLPVYVPAQDASNTAITVAAITSGAAQKLYRLGFLEVPALRARLTPASGSGRLLIFMNQKGNA
jgi:hypothetical protein